MARFAHRHEVGLLIAGAALLGVVSFVPVSRTSAGPAIRSSGITVGSITTRSATVHFITDSPALGSVNYSVLQYDLGSWRTGELLTAIEQGGERVIHSISLTGLTPGTSYYFDVVARPLGNENAAGTASALYSFRTASL